MKNCVVIPTLNEKENIAAILREISAFSFVNAVIIVDDNSRDGTPEIVKQMQNEVKNCRIYLIERKKKKSFSRSYIEGFRFAFQLGAEHIVQMDADGSHDIQSLRQIFHLLNEYDLVIGSRYAKGGKIKGWNIWRRLISYIGNSYARCVLGVPIYDFTSGYNGWRTSFLRNISLEKTPSGYGFQIWLKWKAYLMGAKYKEIPIIFRERKRGNSKFDFKYILEALFSVFYMRVKIKNKKICQRKIKVKE